MPLYMLHGTCGSRVGSIMGHRDGQTIPTDPTLIGNIEHRCLSVLAIRWLGDGMSYFAFSGQGNCGLFCCSSFSFWPLEKRLHTVCL